ncbi:MAG: phosphopantetheine adenylyltransferase, partial [Candidatus Pacebacteria bacterium]|nr:phosphopantetheine adenylyltransferase [Candidatus Paceibacterota bacterium]
SDAMAKRTKKRKVRGFRQRKKDLEVFIRKEFGARARITKIEDKFGPTLKEDFDYIVVSPATYPAAALINRKRRKRKKKNIRIIKIKFVLGKDKKPLSATKILKQLNRK